MQTKTCHSQIISYDIQNVAPPVAVVKRSRPRLVVAPKSAQTLFRIWDFKCHRIVIAPRLFPYSACTKPGARARAAPRPPNRFLDTRFITVRMLLVECSQTQWMGDGFPQQHKSLCAVRTAMTCSGGSQPLNFDSTNEAPVPLSRSDLSAEDVG